MRCGGLSNRSSGPGQSEQNDSAAGASGRQAREGAPRFGQMSDELGREPTDDEPWGRTRNRTEKVARLKSIGIRRLHSTPDWG